MAHIEVKARIANLAEMKRRIEAMLGTPVLSADYVDTYYYPNHGVGAHNGFFTKMRRCVSATPSDTHDAAMAQRNPATGETIYSGASGYASGEFVLYQRAALAADSTEHSDTQLSVLTTAGPEHANLTKTMLDQRLVPDISVHKHRHLYEFTDPVGGVHTRVHLDDVKELGSFVEIECKYQTPEQKNAAIAQSNTLMQSFGIHADTVIPQGNYAALLKRQREQQYPLLTLPVVADLPESLKQTLTTLPQQSYAPGTRLLKDGEITTADDKCAYLILEGRVGVYDAKGRKVNELGAGETVGEFYKILNNNRRVGHVTVIGETPLQAVQIPEAVLEQLLETNQFNSRIMQRLTRAAVAATLGADQAYLGL